MLNFLTVDALVCTNPVDTRDLQDTLDSIDLPRGCVLRMLVQKEASALDLLPVELSHKL